MSEAVVLLSIGRHPHSGRARPAQNDARALGLAATLEPAAATGLYAGPSDPVLRDYLGLGLNRVLHLDLPDGADPLQPLVDHLRRSAPRFVLAGAAAEQGAGSGFLPYAIAAALGVPLVPAVVAVAAEADRWILEQAAHGGRRLRLAVRGPFVATVGSGAPEPPQFAFAKARRGTVQTVPVPNPTASHPTWSATPARPLPKALSGGGASDRAGAARRLMVAPSAEDAAEAIVGLLVREGLLTLPDP